MDGRLGDEEQTPLERIQETLVGLHRALDGVALVVAAEGAGRGDLLVSQRLECLHEDVLRLALHGLAKLVLELALRLPA